MSSKVNILNNQLILPEDMMKSANFFGNAILFESDDISINLVFMKFKTGCVSQMMVILNFKNVVAAHAAYISEKLTVQAAHVRVSSLTQSSDIK